eukprot:4537042-Pleurochrysis_carterae.AAC.1
MVEISKNAPGALQTMPVWGTPWLCTACPRRTPRLGEFAWSSTGVRLPRTGIAQAARPMQAGRLTWPRWLRYELGEFVGGGRVRAVNRRRHPVGQEGANHVLYVTGLGQRDVSVVTLYLDVQEIQDRALVLHVPARGEGIRKVGV